MTDSGGPRPWESAVVEDMLMRLCEELEQREGVEDGDDLYEAVADAAHLDIEQAVAAAVRAAKALEEARNQGPAVTGEARP